MNPSTSAIIQRYLSGEATREEIQSLEEQLQRDPELRGRFLLEAEIDAGLRHEALERVASGQEEAMSHGEREDRLVWKRRVVWLMGAAAMAAFWMGVAAVYWFVDAPSTDRSMVVEEGSGLPSAAGFAVMERMEGVAWNGNQEWAPGETVGKEVVQLDQGMAEMKFFCGATVLVEGPAVLELHSAWEATCHSGAVRVRVPPAARGFRLRGPASEIVDLGTEFGFEVRDGVGHVQVIEGEIALTHRDGPEHLVETGEAWRLPAHGPEESVVEPAHTFPEFSALGGAPGLPEDYQGWQIHRDTVASDPRTVAYYSFEDVDLASTVANVKVPIQPDGVGAVILAEPAQGRWPGVKHALEFRRPGARVRVHLPGEFSAFTFLAWVRIDSLDRRYNALFMGDGYETGEPHWQIRDDGQLMLSVMVDDSRPHPTANEARYHHVYYSPQMWDLSMSGEWVHLASVFDPTERRVTHHVNGKRISTEAIRDLFFIDQLRIGNGEIGNWGQPFRKTPEFAIRNLNGRIDELAVLNAALTDEEIHQWYQRSRVGNAPEE